MTALHPAAALFPDLDLPLEDRPEPPEIWAPDHADASELAFVPLFHQPPARAIATAESALLAEARDAAFQAGVAAGRNAERASREAAMTESLTRIADAMADARWAADAVAEEMAAEMAQLIPDALALALPSLAERLAGRDAIAFTAALLRHLTAEPRVDIRAAPPLATELSAQLARQPNLHVVADSALPEGDVRIAWRNGQAEHRHAAFRDAIRAMLADLLGPADGRHATPMGTER